ncbi:MAG: alpha/beta hydrolase family protein [Candidatus Hodarchaeota archaeon]
MDLKIQNIDIPIISDNIILKGSIYSTSETPLKSPWIIILSGFLAHRDSKFVKAFSERFALAGYYVLAYDYRGHGETAKQTDRIDFIKATPKIFSDIHEVISWILDRQSNKLLDDKIVLFGRSYGGAIILTHGFIDQRAKILIALCSRYDYSTVDIKIPEDLIKKMSPKYFLKNDMQNNNRILIGHCKDDQRMPFKNILQIKEQLGLSDENVIIYDNGGHSFEGHREELFERVIQFLQKL